VGSRIHSPEEFLEVPSLGERAALLALFIQTWYEEFLPARVAERLDLA
jgi:acetylornithine deacetylase/succinyl-diaminopimelate desuccinylase-like protein